LHARVFAVCLFIGIALLVSGCSPSSDEGKPIVIKFPHIVAPGTPKGQGAEMLRQLIEERLGDRVVMEVFPSGQLMNEDDALEALAFGEIQMIAPSLSKFDRLTRKYQVFDLPFLFSDMEDVEAFQQSPVGQELLNVLARKGFIGLAYWHNGMKQFGGPVPIRNPRDGAGLKFRIMESDVLQEQILAMDGNPQKMAFGEVYQALQTGAIDAQENTWSNNYSQKFFEVQDYFIESNHGYLGYLLAVNPGFWNKLPEDIRLELEQIVAEVSAEVNGIARDLNLQDRQKILDSGLSEIVQMTPEDREEWRAVMRPVWDMFRDEIGEDVMAAAEAGSRN
jgi:C4-dicarboxylate-binding protein DctP